MISTFTSLSLPTYYCEPGSPLEADSTGCRANNKVQLTGPQLPHASPLSGYYRPSTASAFVTESAQASAGLRLKQSVLDANQHHSAHQAAGSIFGSRPLRPGALKLLTEAAAANGPPPRETLFSGGGMKNPTFLNMRKGAHMRHTRMRRALIPPEFGSGSGYRTMENTMPIRNLLRDPAKLDQFRANGTIEGVHKVTVPVPGCPAKQRTLCAPTEDETLVIQTEGGRGKYRFSESAWRPVTAPAASDSFPAAVATHLRDSRSRMLPQVSGIRVSGCDDWAAERPETFRRDAAGSGEAGMQRPYTSGSMLAAEDVGMGEWAERRPFTAEGSSVHATALRQLQRDQVQQAGRHFRPSTGSKDISMYTNFRPTRGHMLMVFSAMDEDQNGIITESEFLAVAVDLGIRIEEARPLFLRLDKHRKGFIRLKDWGACDSALRPLVEKLTTHYMRKRMALPSPMLSTSEAIDAYGQRLRLQEVTTLRQVKLLAANYSFQHGSQARITGEDPIAAAMQFVDEEEAGFLGREQVLDALGAIGVHMKPDLADTLMTCCGVDAQGRVKIPHLLSIL